MTITRETPQQAFANFVKRQASWPRGIGHAIVANRRHHAECELRRTRFVLAAFLRKCVEIDRDLDALRGTVADLEIGEYSVVEYVKDLLAQAQVQSEFAALGLLCDSGDEFSFMTAFAHL